MLCMRKQLTINLEHIFATITFIGGHGLDLVRSLLYLTKTRIQNYGNLLIFLKRGYLGYEENIPI